MTTDNRVIIGLELDEDLLYQLMLKAHEHDITLNQLIEKILREYLDAQDHTSAAV
jgi:predicted HicB family RNase H-like nuclease